MRINQVIEKDDGSEAAITGTLSGQELTVVVTLGLNMLYAQGLMQQLVPTLEVEADFEEDDTLVHTMPDEVQ